MAFDVNQTEFLTPRHKATNIVWLRERSLNHINITIISDINIKK